MQEGERERGGYRYVLYSTLSLLKEARRRTEAENASDLLKAAHGDIQARPGAGVHANSKQSFDILCRREGREREEVLMRACRD